MSVTVDNAVDLLIEKALDEETNFALREAAIEGLGYAGGPVARGFLADIVTGDAGSSFGHSLQKLALISLGRASAAE